MNLVFLVISNANIEASVFLLIVQDRPSVLQIVDSLFCETDLVVDPFSFGFDGFTASFDVENVGLDSFCFSFFHKTTLCVVHVHIIILIFKGQGQTRFFGLLL